MDHNLLEIRNLRTTFSTMQGKADAIRGVNLTVRENEILGIVGESGSGKSVTMKSVMGLLPRSAKVTADVLNYKGDDLTRKTEKQLQSYRGREMAMIFQDPMTALNPLRTIGYHLTEVICRYRKVSKKEAEKDRRGNAAAGGHSLSGNTDEAVPSRIFRRYASESHHLHGPVL